MSMRRATNILGLALALGFGQMALTGTSMAQSAPVEGVWETAAKSKVTIVLCPEGYCGYLTEIVVPDEIKEQYGEDALAAVSTFTDELNKDPALRGRPILGMQILTLRPGDKPTVFDGEIYNPQDGNTYSGYVEMANADKLRLNGCILYNVICRGEDWVRVPGAN